MKAKSKVQDRRPGPQAVPEPQEAPFNLFDRSLSILDVGPTEVSQVEIRRYLEAQHAFIIAKVDLDLWRAAISKKLVRCGHVEDGDYSAELLEMAILPSRSVAVAARAAMLPSEALTNGASHAR